MSIHVDKYGNEEGSAAFVGYEMDNDMDYIDDDDYEDDDSFSDSLFDSSSSDEPPTPKLKKRKRKVKVEPVDKYEDIKPIDLYLLLAKEPRVLEAVRTLMIRSKSTKYRLETNGSS